MMNPVHTKNCSLQRNQFSFREPGRKKKGISLQTTTATLNECLFNKIAVRAEHSNLPSGCITENEIPQFTSGQ